MKSIRILFFMFLVLISKFCLAVENNHLFPHEIWASSYLNQNDFILRDNYHPYYILDNNPKTAWVEGVPGSGINERIVFLNRFFKGEKIRFLLRNGYQKSDDLFRKNNRVKDIQVNLISGTQANPKRKTHNFKLKDEMGWQEISIIPEKDIWEISFVILSVYDGIKYDDTCISDILIEIIEQEKNRNNNNNLGQKEKYVKWFEERSKKATFFEDLPSDYPFIPYKKIELKKSVPFEKWDEKKQCLFDSVFFAEILNDSDLLSLNLSAKGNDLFEIINEVIYSNSKICNIKFVGLPIYRPELISEYIFNGTDNFYKISNFQILSSEPANGESKNRWYEIYYDNSLIRKITSNHIATIDGYQRKYSYEYYYDNEGRLIFIKGDVINEDGEISNNALLLWDKGEIIKIFMFFVEHGYNGIDISFSKYY